MNVKGHPNMTINNPTNKLHNLVNTNKIFLNQNLKQYSPTNQNRFQPRIIGNQNLNNLYPNNQRIINYPSNTPKSTLNIMINNPNPIENLNMKALNNNINVKNLNQMKFPTNPNEANNIYPNSVKNVYAIQFNKLGGNSPNMSIRNNNAINQNINYGIRMTSKIPANNFLNINPNTGMNYNNNNTLNFNNNIQNSNVNNLNYPLYQYQPQII